MCGKKYTFISTGKEKYIGFSHFYPMGYKYLSPLIKDVHVSAFVLHSIFVQCSAGQITEKDFDGNLYIG